jgi:DNA-binding Lrp family transcriptional regulator
MADLVFDDLDTRLTAALQVDGRASPEKIADALDLPARAVARRLTALLRTGALRVTAVRPRDPRERISVLRVKVLRGKVDVISAALARRPDVAFVDISSTGEEISAVITSSDGVLATTGAANLNVAVWLPDLDELYEFITRDLAALDVTTAETVLVGQAVKRPGIPSGEKWRGGTL